MFPSHFKFLSEGLHTDEENVLYDVNFISSVDADDLDLTLFEWAEHSQTYIPFFCYHENLSIVGNCRVCIVEQDGISEPVMACATELTSLDTNVYYTNTSFVRAARESILEFLLINHPLDCAICDQGGECDLQDQAVIYGGERSRFTGVKRSVADLDLGPFIKAIMTRCIHCTRCVRYVREITGSAGTVLGMLNRGFYSEIGTYENFVFTEDKISGNIADICPVGALTTKPFAYRYRSWELYSIETIDILDSLCSTIRVDIIGNEILRILPKINNSLNDEWITDKVRFSFDGYTIQRISFPYIRTDSSRFIQCSWDTAFRLIELNMERCWSTVESISTFFFFSGLYVDTYSQLLFKYISHSIGVPYINIKTNCYTDLRISYLINNVVTSFDDSSFFFLCGLDIQLEVPILNIRIRRITSLKNYSIFYVGSPVFLNYSFFHIGFMSQSIVKFMHGQLEICFFFYFSTCPSFFFGSSTHSYSHFYKSLVTLLGLSLSRYISYHRVSLFASDIAMNDISLVNSMGFSLTDSVFMNSKFMYILGTTKRTAHQMALSRCSHSPFIVFHGSHFEEDSSEYDVLLPSPTYLENSYETYFLNCEGRSFFSNKVLDTGINSVSSVLRSIFESFTFQSQIFESGSGYICFYESYLLHIPYIKCTKYSVLVSKFCYMLVQLYVYSTRTLSSIFNFSFTTCNRHYYGMDIVSRISTTIKSAQIEKLPCSNFKQVTPWPVYRL